MITFSHTIVLFGVRIHSWSLICLALLWTYILIGYKRYGVFSAVIATSAVTLCIHLYETLHGIGSLWTLGYVGRSLWIMNIPFSIAIITSLIFINRKWKILKWNAYSYTALLSFVLSMYVLVLDGFYFGYQTQLIFSTPWGISKAMSVLFVSSIFDR